MLQPSESEWKTRKQRIDPRLVSAGWKLAPFGAASSLSAYHQRAVEEYPTEAGPADYALCLDGSILAVVEAKKITLGPQNVLTQAERYSRGATSNPLTFGDFRVPFVYSTNGEVMWFRDLRHPLSLSRKVANFHTPSALKEMLARDFDGGCEWLKQTPNDHGWLRPYQTEANAAIEQAIAARKRQMLVAMATGTGKTVTLVNEIHRLIKSGVGKRILFLVDRRALAAQAVRTFASFEAEPGVKFDKIYEVYSQRFQRDDVGDEGGFDPCVLPEAYNAPGKLDRGISYKAVSEQRRGHRSWRHSETTTVPSSKPR
jgi:type I restriction enzyme R subunit